MAHAAENGISIVYDDAGQGEPALLLMPGWCANRTVYRDLAPLCGGRRRVLVLDWRGHGESGLPHEDFGNEELVEDASKIIRASGAQRVVPVTMAHAGWVAIELRQQLGGRIEKLVLLDWIVARPPRQFFEALDGMQSPERWRETVERISSVWLGGVENVNLTRFVRAEMGSYGFEMWSRAAREIAAAYAEAGTPLQALANLVPPLPVLHLYGQPEDPEYLAAQESFAGAHPWFKVQRLKARSHFPMFEAPEDVASAIDQFVGEGA